MNEIPYKIKILLENLCTSRTSAHRRHEILNALMDAYEYGKNKTSWNRAIKKEDSK